MVHISYSTSTRYSIDTWIRNYIRTGTLLLGNEGQQPHPFAIGLARASACVAGAAQLAFERDSRPGGALRRRRDAAPVATAPSQAHPSDRVRRDTRTDGAADGQVMRAVGRGGGPSMRARRTRLEERRLVPRPCGGTPSM